MLTYKEKYKIFREMQHSFYVEDAVNQVNEYFGLNEDNDAKKELDYNDYELYSSLISAKEILADEFEDKKDCNFPDNDIWESVIKDYILIRC